MGQALQHAYLDARHHGRQQCRGCRWRYRRYRDGRPGQLYRYGRQLCRPRLVARPFARYLAVQLRVAECPRHGYGPEAQEPLPGRSLFPESSLLLYPGTAFRRRTLHYHPANLRDQSVGRACPGKQDLRTHHIGPQECHLTASQEIGVLHHRSGPCYPRSRHGRTHPGIHDLRAQ